MVGYKEAMTIQIKDNSPKTYVVLGMHQGGTSIISKALAEQKIDMGSGDNKGTYEDLAFVQLNEDLLRRAGGTWFNPPSREQIEKVTLGFAGRIANLFNGKRKDFWGWKDPRQPITFDAVKDNLKDDVYLVCVFRKPEKVGESLSRRSSPKINGTELAKTYYRRIIEIVQEFAEL